MSNGSQWDGPALRASLSPEARGRVSLLVEIKIHYASRKVNNPAPVLRAHGLMGERRGADGADLLGEVLFQPSDAVFADARQMRLLNNLS